MAAPPKHSKMRLTERRKETFLNALARTGSFPAASRAASPHASTRWGASKTFRDEEKRNPEFASQVEEARLKAIGVIEQTIYDRAVDGIEEPIWEHGKLVGTRKVYDNKLLMRLASKLEPAWAEKRHNTVEGHIEHRHGPRKKKTNQKAQRQRIPSRPNSCARELTNFYLQGALLDGK